MKKFLLIIGVIIFLGAGALAILNYADSIKNISLETGQQTNRELKAETKNISEKNASDNYEVKADYPEFTGIDSTIGNKINSDIKNTVIAITDDFKKNAKENCDFSDLPNPPVWTCELFVSFGNFELTEKILSLPIEYYQFLGGAHGGTTYQFLNYNTDTGERFDWKNYFKFDSQYMQKIAEYSKQDLEKQLLKPEELMTNEDWINRGTEPTLENYNTNVGFTKNGLIIIFQQYQVAAYAAGPQKVIIPYSELQDFIN